ncbi:hypothetical protein LSAT2_030853 [Lamellibrachia satsuma]|nr:hypothetical protein LSAT2_030853 [Lamellibrachia satsuma]
MRPDSERVRNLATLSSSFLENENNTSHRHSIGICIEGGSTWLAGVPDNWLVHRVAVMRDQYIYDEHAARFNCSHFCCLTHTHVSLLAAGFTVDCFTRLLALIGSDISRTSATMGKISNFTNSNDPQAINSRVFIGNLNTFALSKANVERMFMRYGHIIAISMHKGYAFIQYMNEFEARCAVAGEDQRLYANQPIDVNLASEPKPNRPSRKRPHGAGAEW